MSGSVNKVILVGNLARDVEVRHTQDGRKIVNMTVATSEKWTDRSSGEKKERAEFHRVVVFDDNLGEVAERYLNKGSKVYLEGQLQTRKWQDQSGADRYSTEVVLQKYRSTLVMLGDGGGQKSQNATGGYARSHEASRQMREQRDGMDSLDDEIPF